MNFNNDKERILIVDDEAFNIQAVKIVMQTVAGIINPNSICDEAENGQEAVDIVKDDIARNKCCSYSLILIDQNMPIQDGLSATREIRQYIHEKGLA